MNPEGSQVPCGRCWVLPTTTGQCDLTGQGDRPWTLSRPEGERLEERADVHSAGLQLHAVLDTQPDTQPQCLLPSCVKSPVAWRGGLSRSGLSGRFQVCSFTRSRGVETARVEVPFCDFSLPQNAITSAVCGGGRGVTRASEQVAAGAPRETQLGDPWLSLERGTFPWVAEFDPFGVPKVPSTWICQVVLSREGH